MQKEKHHFILLLRLIISCVRSSMSALVMLLIPLASTGQDPDSEGEIYTLSPFEVSTSNDRGYQSTNTTSGTSLNTPIRDLPMSLDVINLELIEDLQASDMKETLSYSAGVFTGSSGTSSAMTAFNERSPSAVGSANDPFQNNISIRGYSVPNQQREGFRVGGLVPAYGVVLGGSTDTITTERTEVVRGPQALLYGLNVLSGIVNIKAKRPLSEPVYRVGLSVGSEDYLRATLDTTGPLIKNTLNYRFMAARDEIGDPIMFRDSKRSTAAIQFDYKISSKISLFVEYLHSEQKNRGIGTQFLTDDRAGTVPLMNRWGESIRYGRDDPSQPLRNVHDIAGNDWEDPLYRNPKNDPDFYSFTDLGRYFNISGPDTYRKRKEDNILAALTIQPADNFTIELGAYYTKLKEEELNVDLRTFSRVGVLSNQNALRPGLTESWVRNPEAANAYEDRIGFGIGEVFMLPRTDTTPFGYNYHQRYIAPPENPDFGVSGGETRDSELLTRKFARYIWYQKPTTSETIQLRGRANYQLETDFLGIEAKHNFVGGYHFIQDDINFVTGGVNGNGDNNYYSLGIAPTPARLFPPPGIPATPGVPGREEYDAVYFRESVFDFTPLQLREGDVIAVPGTRTQANLGGHTPGALDITRSGWKESTLWFRGIYGVYQGQYWNDRLTVIGGVRRDEYQVREKEQLMVVDRNALSDQWMGNGQFRTAPGFIGYGDQPYVWRDDLPDALNQAVEDSINKLRYTTTTDAHGNMIRVPNQINGTIEHNFPDYQSFTTGTFGLSWRITDDWSLYGLYSEGIFPNSGHRDGMNQPIEAEQTSSRELGLKFDLLNGKVSGTISIWQIKRKNAIYGWNAAPAPKNWHGGENAPPNPQELWFFSPKAAQGEDPAFANGTPLPVSYGVSIAYVEEAFRQLNEEGLLNEAFPTGRGEPAHYQSYEQYGAVGGSERTVVDAVGENHKDYFLIVPYETFRNDPNAAVMKRAFDLAMVNAPVLEPWSTDPNAVREHVPYNGSGILWRNVDTLLNNPSEIGLDTTNVLFEEEGLGIDGQLIFSPVPNYQIVLGFAHQKREVTGRGFKLVDAIDADGNTWGTEYDRWVYILGSENFEDPTKPSTFTGGSVRGLDLSGVPQTSFTIWNKYTFNEGILDGLEVGGGLRYEGSFATAVPIGGANLAQNQYLTPDVPDRYELEAFLGYRITLWDIDWRIGLNVRNLFNDTQAISTVQYQSSSGADIERRTVRYYEPRTWRLTVSAKF